MKESQNASYFPNDNSKHIDYVLCYKQTNEKEFGTQKNLKEWNKNKFLEILEKDFSIINEEIKYENDEKTETHEFILLHCPLEHLLKQAEKIRLEMRIKDDIVELSLFLFIF